MTDELPAVTLARIEGKLDLINAELTRHNTRADDHEARLRSLEGRSVVTWRAFLSVLAAVTGVVGAAAPFLAQLYNGG